MISYNCVAMSQNVNIYKTTAKSKPKSINSYLERLRIPIADFSYGRHFIQAIWKVTQLLDTVCETDGELFGQEL